ncbi:hypothetical protein MY4038_010326 [Beauveria bassiana]
MSMPYQHCHREVAVAGKRGSKLLRMTEELACRVYWKPADKCYRVAAQLSKGESAPDLNGLPGGCPEHTERVPGLSQESLAILPNNDSDGLRDRNN